MNDTYEQMVLLVRSCLESYGKGELTEFAALFAINMAVSERPRATAADMEWARRVIAEIEEEEKRP